MGVVSQGKQQSLWVWILLDVSLPLEIRMIFSSRYIQRPPFMGGFYGLFQGRRARWEEVRVTFLLPLFYQTPSA